MKHQEPCTNCQPDFFDLKGQSITARYSIAKLNLIFLKGTQDVNMEKSTLIC